MIDENETDEEERDNIINNIDIKPSKSNSIIKFNKKKSPNQNINNSGYADSYKSSDKPEHNRTKSYKRAADG